MDLSFGVSAYGRTRGNIAEMPVINMIAESAPSEGRIVLQSRPGLSMSREVGLGPVRGLFRRDGVLQGDTYTVSGEALFRNETSLGGVAIFGPVSFAGDELSLLVNGGGDIYKTDGTTLSAESFPDGTAVIKVLELAGYFVAIMKGTAKFYWRFIGEFEWQADDYATAESEPDQLLEALAIDDYLVLLGSETVEFWPKTGDAELPFIPTQGRVFEKGVRATGCATAFDNTFAWVSPDHIVYRAGNVPERISDSGIEERVSKSANCLVYSFFWEGHELLAVKLDAGTWLYDAQTRQWCEWASYGRLNFAPMCAIPGPLFGDDTDGKVWAFNDGYTDNGGPMERRFRAGAALEGPVKVNCIRLTGNSGQTPNLTGDYSDPRAECRFSRDAGQTWSKWLPTSLGERGKYRKRVEWRRFGTMDDPGVLMEFRVTDPVPFRVSRVQVNPPKGGRSR